MMPSHDTRWTYKPLDLSAAGMDVRLMVPVLVADEEHESAEGSLFFELHRQLALEADRQIIALVESLWRSGSAESPESDRDVAAVPTLDPEAVVGEARGRSAAEATRAGREGRTFVTGRESGVAGANDVTALVDLFISHPDDSSWWQPILQGYVNAHEAEVIAHIRARNKTRSERK